MNTELQIWTKAERAVWELPEDLTVSEWADRHRVLDPDTSEESGQYKSSWTPYMVVPMDAFGDDEVEEIDMMFPAQVGKSTALQNMIGYAIDQDPAPTMYVVPRDDDRDYVNTKIFRPMVELSAKLRSHITDKARDLQLAYFTFDRMTLYFNFAGSPIEMAQKSIKNLFFDEPDKYPPFAGREAGSIALAIERTVTFREGKIVKACTPTTKLGNIWISYDKSNKCEYYLPCPHCGEWRDWKFVQLRVPKKLRDPDEIIEKNDVWYECEVCGARIREIQKTELVAAGKYVPKGQYINADGNLKGTAERGRRHSGFHTTALVSPFPKVSWARIMAKWFAANTEEGIALGELLNFKNSTEGVPFEETGKRIKSSQLRGLRGDYSKGTVPPEALILVASADYHKTITRGIMNIIYEVRAFGYSLKNWLVTSGSVASFEDLDKAVLLSPFPWSDGTEQEKKPWLAVMVEFIDCGYEPDDVYEYCRQRPGLTIPTKGMAGPLLKPLQPSDLESATERRLNARQRRRYRGMQLMLIDTYYFKNQVTSWVEPKVDEEGKITAEPLTTFYNETPYYYFREFGNEQKVKVRDTKGNVKWVWQTVTRGAPTHSLDTAVYAAAAGFYKGVQYLKKPGEKVALPAAAARRTPRKRKRRPRGGGFLGGLNIEY